MTAPRHKFICLDCGVDTGQIHEHYMLHDKVWLTVAPKRGMLCIGCIEYRLGRELSAQDFNDSYLNRPQTAPQSLRLRNRLTRRPIHHAGS